MERTAEVSLHCTHSYCSACIRQWSSAHTECPLCRGDIGSEDDEWVLQGTPTSREVRGGAPRAVRRSRARARTSP